MLTLDSWKEIAAYLKRSIKTCRRWEQELGLPVHRLEDSPKARVFAYQDELDLWIREKLQDEEEPRKRPFYIHLKKITLLIISSVIIIALVTIGIVIWKHFFQENLEISTVTKPYVLIMYFQNRTGNKDYDIWKDSLCRMIIADLSQSRYLRVVPYDRLFGILRKLNLQERNNYSREDLKKVASMEGTNLILQAFFTESGGFLRINATLQDADTMEIIASELVGGRVKEGFHAMIDELSRRIEAKFSVTRNQIEDDLHKRGD